MDARQLAYFLAVADHGSFSRAAGSLYLAQPSPAVQPLSDMIGTYLRRYPAMRVDVRAAPTAAEVTAQVHTGAVEIGLAGTAGELQSTDVAVHPAGRQRFVLLAPPDGPLRPGRAVTLDDLAGLTAIVAPPGTRARQLVDEARVRGVSVRIGVEAAHREAVLPLVVQGSGVAVVTEAWTDLARSAGALVLDLEPPQYLHISLLARRAPLTSAARAFLDSVQPGLIGGASKAGSEPVVDGESAGGVESPLGQQGRPDGQQEVGTR